MTTQPDRIQVAKLTTQLSRGDLLKIDGLGYFAVYSCLVGDSYTQVAIDRELADMGVTPDEVASTFAVMAAAMLVEACDSQAEATALAARWTRKITARSARAVNARDASAA